MDERGRRLSEVKDELSAVVERAPSARKAEVAALLRFAGGVRIVGEKIVVDAEVDHRPTAQRLSAALYELFGSAPALHTPRGDSGGRTLHLVRVTHRAEDLARQTGLIDRRGMPVRGMPAHVVRGTRGDNEAAWRGAILAAGALTTSGQRQGLTVRCPGMEAGLALVGLARRLGVAAQRREIRGQECVVVRADDDVSALLSQIGAPRSSDSWTNRRHRIPQAQMRAASATFESANATRAAAAAARATGRVRRALEILGDTAPDHLAAVGQLRLQHPDVPLLELGRLADPPMSKDAVAGRIRRLVGLADRTASKAGLPDTSSAA